MTSHDPGPGAGPDAIDDDAISPQAIGRAVRSMRLKAGASLQDLAAGTGLSKSFLSMLERGETDVAIGRLSRIAAFFGHDIASFLGYSRRRPVLARFGPSEQVHIDRGEGLDTFFVLDGTVELLINGRAHLLRRHEGGSFSALHEHSLRNPTDEPAVVLAISSELVF